MTQSLQIGPLALPYGVLLAFAAIAIGWAVGIRFGRAAGADAEPLLMRMLIVGVVAARLAYVWEWREAYSMAPWSVLDIRDGGWEAVAGILAAGLYGAYRTRVNRACGGLGPATSTSGLPRTWEPPRSRSARRRRRGRRN